MIEPGLKYFVLHSPEGDTGAMYKVLAYGRKGKKTDTSRIIARRVMVCARFPYEISDQRVEFPYPVEVSTYSIFKPIKYLNDETKSDQRSPEGDH